MNIKRIAALALMGGIGIGAATTAVAGPGAQALAEAVKDPIYAATHWDDDHDRLTGQRKISPMLVPDAAAVRNAGMVRVAEVERDDGRIEIEGYDAKGREIELVMDAGGKRVLSVRRENDWDD